MTQITPRTGEVVIANISKVMKFGAYCKLLEYNNLEVFLPIREVSSGWIKNIREFIHEGQTVVCEVVFYDKEKNTIDISLKRVTQKKAKERIRAYNLEKRLAALFIQAAKEAGEQANREALTKTALAEFNTYTNMVENAKNNTDDFKRSTLPKKLKAAVIKILETNIKKKRFITSYIATMSTYNTLSGVTELRGIFSEIKNMGIDVKYISAPKYRLMSEGIDYPDAEKKISQAEALIKEKLGKGVFSMEKEKLRRAKEDIMEGV
jgi:translation initiation factor 2 alpha subunit (eIF-2alpha)